MLVPYPLVSVIMPIRNEADFIERSLGSLLRQDYPHDLMEILIADGMSTDETRHIVSQVAADHPDIPIRIVDNPAKIVATGLNIALRHVRGDIIVRVDGHCVVAPDFISKSVRHLSEDGADAVGGPVETIPSSLEGQAIALAMSSSFGVGDSAFRTTKGKTLFVDTVAFPAYTREAIKQAGSFDEGLVRNQDDEYNYRLRELGYKILLAQDVHSQYFSRSSFKSLSSQYFQYGYWKVRVMQKHPRQMCPRHFVPPLFVAALTIGAVLSPFSSVVLLLWFGVVGLYLLASLTVSAWIAQGAGWRFLTTLPLAFGILHVSYGTGFLAGLARFPTVGGCNDREG